MDVDELIKEIRPPEGSVRLCLRGDLLADFAALEQEVKIVVQGDPHPSMASGVPGKALADRMEALLREIGEHTHEFRFRALPQRQFRDLQEDHPPREGNALDAAVGCDVETFPSLLVRQCCIEPVMAEEQVDALFNVLTDGQVMELFLCALHLNWGRVDYPKFETASSILDRHAPRSKRLAHGGSVAEGSSAGSLAG